MNPGVAELGQDRCRRLVESLRETVKDRLDGFLFGRDRTDPARQRCPACGRDSLEFKLSRYGPFVSFAEYPDCGCRRSLGVVEEASFHRKVPVDTHVGL